MLVDAKRESDEFQRAAGGAVAGDDTADSVQKPQTLAGLVTAAESLARKQLPSLAGNATQVLVPLLGAMSADRVRKLLPALVAAADSAFPHALDRLCGARARRRQSVIEKSTALLVLALEPPSCRNSQFVTVLKLNEVQNKLRSRFCIYQFWFCNPRPGQCNRLKVIVQSTG